jgi:hypothetical protein
MDRRYTCASCGANIPLREFKTATGKTFGDQALDLGRDFFKKP